MAGRQIAAELGAISGSRRLTRASLFSIYNCRHTPRVFGSPLDLKIYSSIVLKKIGRHYQANILSKYSTRGLQRLIITFRNWSEEHESKSRDVSYRCEGQLRCELAESGRRWSHPSNYDTSPNDDNTDVNDDGLCADPTIKLKPERGACVSSQAPRVFVRLPVFARPMRSGISTHRSHPPRLPFDCTPT